MKRNPEREVDWGALGWAVWNSALWFMPTAPGSEWMNHLIEIWIVSLLGIFVFTLWRAYR